LTAQVLVAGQLDDDAWSPGDGTHVELWLHLRLLFCQSVWLLHGRRAATGQPFTAAAVVAVTAARLEHAIRQDWLRVWVLLPGMPELPSWCVLRRQYALGEDEFRQRWCIGGVLASVQPGEGKGRLHVHVPRALPG
jgi:hypothetical protein